MANDELLPAVIQLLDEGHTVTLPLRGYSMRPFLENMRDKALLQKPTDIRIGDAVLAPDTMCFTVLSTSRGSMSPSVATVT